MYEVRGILPAFVVVAVVVAARQGFVIDIQGVKLTAQGTMVVNSFLQEDRLAIPGRREVVLHQPLILEEETGDVVYHATTSGRPGHALERLLCALEEGKARLGVYIDTGDSAKTNWKNFRLLVSMVEKRLLTPRLLLKFARCDGHQYHTVASIALSRAAVASAIFSSALMLRVGTYKWRMRSQLQHIIGHELQWAQGGEVPILNYGFPSKQYGPVWYLFLGEVPIMQH